MSFIFCFVLAFAFSFIGSIPPGTINLTIVQLGLEKKMDIAWKFALASALIEYPYCWLAIEFKSMILSSDAVLDNMKLITAIVMLLLGSMNVLSSSRPSTFSLQFHASGFRRGILLGILNPLAMPYWLGVTAYLEAQKWIDLSSMVNLQSYLVGVSLGALTILLLFAHLAGKIVVVLRHSARIKKIPGFVLLGLGVYGLIEYIF